MLADHFNFRPNVPVQIVAQQENSTVELLRLDTWHPVISGNKWFKLKFHLKAAINCKSIGIISYGGYWSNHLVSVAYAAQLMGLASVGIVNGIAVAEEKRSQTLKDCVHYGMQLEFVGRKLYQERDTAANIAALQARFPGYYIIPEGAADALGVEGAASISALVDDFAAYTDVCCSIGSGTMMAGLILASTRNHLNGIMNGVQTHATNKDDAESADLLNRLNTQQVVHGFAAFKSTEPIAPMIELLLPFEYKNSRFNIVTAYDFGGFSKCNPALIQFMNEFYTATQIPTDRVYSAKLLAGVLDLFNKSFFRSNARVLVIHCGGLQGNLSFPQKTLVF